MKSMKKSMFISTILLVVLLIVALSTATFAWYTANNNVGTAKYTVTSATSNTANLVIDNIQVTDVSATRNSVTLTLSDSTTALQPLVFTDTVNDIESDSVTAPVVGTTTYGDFVGKFYNFTQNNSAQFNATPAKMDPATISSVTGSDTSSTNIYLTNVGNAAIATINAKITIEPTVYEATVPDGDDVTGKYIKNGDNYELTTDTTAQAGTTYYDKGENKNLRVAIFAGESTDADNDLVLKGIVGAGNMQVAAADILTATTGDSISEKVGSTTFALTASGADIAIAASTASMGAVKVKVVAWFEGQGMTNAIAGTTSSFTMSFAG